MKVSISTLGCKSNQYDSSAIEAVLKDNNFKIAGSSDAADVFIINTCTVTGKADYQSRQLIRRAKAANPDAVIVVTGCYAQVSAQEAAKIDGVDYVLGNPEKEKVLQYIFEGKRKYPKIDVTETAKDTPLTLRAKGSSGRTRAYLKAQDGCNNSCSYCIIPRARGVSRSLPVSEILNEIESLVASGYKEIILTGIHLGAYGLDLDSKTDIAGLVKAIDEKNYPCRFRISSLDPDEVSDELIEIMTDSKTICNHLHLPLQSGDDNILKGMNRRYTGKLFAERVEKIIKAIPEISIGVDVIVGFPGEDEKKFLNTYSLLEKLLIAYMHIFPFSKRNDTAAANFSDQTDAKVVKERCERLRILDKIKRKKFYEKFIGKKAWVLIEASRDEETGFLTGRSRNYIPFLIKACPVMSLNGSGNELTNLEIDVIGNEVNGDRMIGYAIGR